MSTHRSRSWWAFAAVAVVALGVAGFIVGQHDSGSGAQAQSNPPSYEPEGGISSEEESSSSRDVIYAAELVGPREGWARTNSRLAWTTDGGATWSTITPPGIDPRTILAVRFDGSGDGIVVACREVNAVPVPLEFFYTTDDGRTWRASNVEAEGPGSIGSVRALEADGNWWVLVDEAGIAREGTRLYRSEDSGQTWQARPRPPASGPFVFFSQEEGWIVGGERSQLVYRTDDAGGTWEQIEVPLPGTTGSEEGTTVPQEGAAEPEEFLTGPERVVEYGLPERSPEGVFLPATVTTPAGDSEVLLFESSDSTAWNLVAATELAHQATSGEITTTFVAPGELLIQDPSGPAAFGPPALTKVSTRSGGSGASRETEAVTTDLGHASGLPELLPLQFIDRVHGVAVQGKGCRLSGCSEVTELFLTDDGGRTWTPAPTRP